jgi:hypothetical protein
MSKKKRYLVIHKYFQMYENYSFIQQMYLFTQINETKNQQNFATTSLNF